MSLRKSLAFLVLSASLPFVQHAHAATSVVAFDPPPATFDLGPGEKVTDGQGRVIENTGTNGYIKIVFTGTKSGSGQNIEITGGNGVTTVTMPATGGSKSMSVKTTGDATNVELKKNGNTADHNSVSIEGGNANITIEGDYNDYTVDGTGNTVSVASSGQNNSGSGTGTSGGTYTNSGGTSNSFTTGGGSWTIH